MRINYVVHLYNMVLCISVLHFTTCKGKATHEALPCPPHIYILEVCHISLIISSESSHFDMAQRILIYDILVQYAADPYLVLIKLGNIVTL